MSEVKKAKIKVSFGNGFNLSPDMSAEDALRSVLNAMDSCESVKMKVEYMDGTEAELEDEDEEEDEAEEEDDEEDDDDEEEVDEEENEDEAED